MVHFLSWLIRPSNGRRSAQQHGPCRLKSAATGAMIGVSFFLALGAEASITIDERPDRWVVQRSAGSGALELAGTTDAAGAVEARVLGAQTGAAVTAWTTVDPAPAGASWSGVLGGIPEGGWYRVEARRVGSPEVSTQTAGTFGVGLVVAAIGQSNMVKMFTEDEGDGSLEPPYESPSPATWRYGYGEPAGYEYKRPRTVDVPISWGEVTGTGGIRLANSLAAQLGVPVLMLDFSLDWTGIDDHWNNDGHRSWQRFSEALDLVGSIGVVIWHQGAYDANEHQPTVASYKAGLDTLYQRITDRVGGFGTLPMVVAIQNRGDYDFILAKDAYYDAVRQAQREWIAERAHGFAAGDSNDLDITSRPGTGSGHFWAAEYEVLADRMARGALRALAHPGFEDGVRGAAIEGATVRGTTVHVHVAHDVGARLRLEDPGADIEGFTFTDGDWLIGGGTERNHLPIVSAQLSDDQPGNWVQIELGEAPVGPLRLRYLHGQNPFYAKPSKDQRRRNGNTLYDDFAYHPERAGLPVTGTAGDLAVDAGGAVLVGGQTVASQLTVQEGGASQLEVTLSDPPGGSVTVTATLYGDSDLTLDAGTLSFNDGNYALPQALTISAGVDADIANGSALLRLTAPAHHGALATVREQDADPHFEVAPSNLVMAGSGSAGFEVALGAPPAGPVTVDITTGDATALGVSPSSLLFDPGNWQTPQGVVLTGLLDSQADSRTVLVSVAVDPAASDDGYDSAPMSSVTVDLLGIGDGLLVHWPLDESSGSVAADVSGNGHDGAIGADVKAGVQGVRGTAMTAAGPGGSSGSLADGVLGSSVTGGGLSSPSLDELTVSFWYRLPASAKDGYLFTWGGSYTDPDSVSLYMDAGQELRVRVHDAGDTSSTSSVAPPGFDDAAWHHLALVKDGGGHRLYFDGALAGTSADGAGSITPPAGITLGTNELGKYGLVADFDELRIYDRALVSAEIASLFALGGGQVSVEIQPAAAAAAGALWQLASQGQGGGQWYAGGQTVTAGAGARLVTFSAPAGWAAPADQPIDIALGETTSVIATFVEEGTGTLSVDVQPAAAGGQWQLVQDGIWRDGGDVVSLAAGDYDLSFSAVAGWIAPADRTLTLVEGQTETLRVDYIDAATADPIAYLPLDESSGNLAADISGQARDGVYGGDVVLGADGVFAAAAGTGGAGGATGAFDDGISVAGLAGGSYQQATVSFWYRLPAAAHSGYLLTWGGSYNDPSHFSIYYNEGANLRVRVRGAGDTSSLEEVAPPGFDDASWHHVVLTKAPSGASIYFDGQLVRASPMGSGTIAPSTSLRLGANENGQWGIEAAFDDLRVWERELPPTEIAELYAAGQRGSLQVELLPAGAIGGRWRVAEGPQTGWQTSGSRLDDLPTGTYTLEFDEISGWLKPNAQIVTIGVGDDLQRVGVYALAGGPLLEWLLDEAAGPIAFDSSGNGHDGVHGADVTVGVAGLLARGASTAGTGTSGGSAADAIVTPDLAPDDAYLEATVSLWYRLDVQHDGYLFSWGGSFNDPDHFSVYLDPQSGLRYRAHDAGDTTPYLQVAPPGFADAGWHHVVLVKDAAGSRAYFDGARVASSATMGDGVVTPQGPFSVGANEVGTFGIEATFDEVAVWDRSFSDAEVLQLYQTQGVVPITASLAPAQAVADGGAWRLEAGGETGWNADGATVLVPPGPNTVTFAPLSQWRSPADMPITAVLGAPLTLQASYRSLQDGQLRVDLSPSGAVAAGAAWRLVDGPEGGIWRQSGDQITLAAGIYTLELAPAAGYLTPDSQTVVVPDNDLLVLPVSYSVGGGPILYWPLDAANPGLDVGGFGRHASVGGQVATGLGGVAGEAVQTAGLGGAAGTVDQGLVTGDFDTADAYGEATVTLWYRLPAQPRDGYLFAWGGSNNDPDQLSAFMDAGVELRIRVRDSLDSTSVLSVTPSSFDDSAWHHLAVVKDAAGTKVYFDGALVASHIMGSGIVRPQDGFYLGFSENFEFGIEASFDEVRVWDRALGELEIADLVASTPPPTGFGGAYRTVDELYADLLQAAVDYPSIVEVLDYGDSYAKTAGGHISPGGDFIAGDDLLAARVTNRSITGTKPHFVLMACLHAREIATPELAMRLLDELTTLYGVDPDVTWLVDSHEIWILPMANPDGYRYVALGAEAENGAVPWRWRKSVRPGGSCGWPPLDGSSTQGVDLNRNFPFEWGTSSGQAGSSDLCSENYRGESAGSEPETQAIMSLVRSLISDQRGPGATDSAPSDASDIFIQLHSPFRIVSWPWGHTDEPAPNAVGLQAIGEKLAGISGYASGQVYDGVYHMTGTADDWVYGELGAAALLIEVGEGLMPPYHKIDNVLWPEMRDSFLHAAKIARAPYQLVHGPDAAAITATATAGGFDLQATVDDTTSGGLAITAAEAYVSLPPWDASALPVPLTATDGAFDQPSEDVNGFLDTSALASGQHLVWVRAQDTAGHWGPPTAVFIDVP